MKHVRTSHVDFNEGMNDYLISQLLELVCEMKYQTTSESNRKESNMCVTIKISFLRG